MEQLLKCISNNDKLAFLRTMTFTLYLFWIVNQFSVAIYRLLIALRDTIKTNIEQVEKKVDDMIQQYQQTLTKVA